MTKQMIDMLCLLDLDALYHLIKLLKYLPNPIFRVILFPFVNQRLSTIHMQVIVFGTHSLPLATHCNYINIVVKNRIARELQNYRRALSA